VCWGKINTEYHIPHCLRCSGGGDGLLKAVLSSKRRTLKESDTFDSLKITAAKIISTFAKHVVRPGLPDNFILSKDVTDVATSALEEYVSQKKTIKDYLFRLNNFYFDQEVRLFTRAIDVPLEYLVCGKGSTKSSAAYILDDISEAPATKELLLIELDPSIDYVMIDENDRACMFFEKPGPILHAKIAQHQAEAFMSKHGIKADMMAMEADMRKDYGDLMNTVTSEARAMRLRL
jgi:hypothetical protein